jgi:hypothetical protein
MSIKKGSYRKRLDGTAQHGPPGIQGIQNHIRPSVQQRISRSGFKAQAGCQNFTCVIAKKIRSVRHKDSISGKGLVGPRKGYADYHALCCNDIESKDLSWCGPKILIGDEGGSFVQVHLTGEIRQPPGYWSHVPSSSRLCKFTIILHSCWQLAVGSAENHAPSHNSSC